MKKLFSVILACFMATAMASAVMAVDMMGNTPKYYYVVDEADVLTDEQEAELNAYAEQICGQYSYDLVLYFPADLYGGDAQALADDYYDYSGYGVGENNDGQILMVSPFTRDYAFSGCGAGIDMFDAARLDELEATIVNYLSDNDWYGAGYAYFYLCEKDLQQGMPKKTIPFTAIPIDLILGYLLAMAPIGAMKGQLKSVSQSHSARNYVVENGVKITKSNDRFVNKVVTRTPIQTRSSSSSGSSGTHRSSSGTTHSGRSGKF